MKQIAIKDLQLFFMNRRSLMLTFFVPIALISLFATIFGGSSGRVSRAQTLVVVDEDQTDESLYVVTKLDSLREFEVRRTTLDSAQHWVKKGDEPSLLVFHEGFSDSLRAGKTPPMELQYDASKEAELGILQAALIGNLMRILGPRTLQKKALARFDGENPNMDSVLKKKIHKEITENFKTITSKETNPLTLTPLITEKENSAGLIHAVAGTSIMMLLFAVASMGASILDEKQEGTLKRLLYSPIHPNQILLGKMISINVICILQLTVMYVYAWLVFGLAIGQNIPGLVIMIIATAFACSSFGVVLASFAKTRAQVQGLSTLIVLTMSAIGGSMIPTFAMPPFMQKMSVFSVNYWSIQGFYDIFWRRLSPVDPDFLFRVFVLMAIGLTLSVIAMKMFRKNVFTML